MLRVPDLSQRPRDPGRYLDMLACHRLLKKSVDAPEVNENIWFLPDLFISQLGRMSWQVTLVQRRIGDCSGGLLLSFQQRPHWPQPRNTAEYVLGSGNSLQKLTKPDLHPCVIQAESSRSVSFNNWERKTRFVH